MAGLRENGIAALVVVFVMAAVVAAEFRVVVTSQSTNTDLHGKTMKTMPALYGKYQLNKVGCSHGILLFCGNLTGKSRYLWVM
jgi:hypothetical protein